MRQTEDILSVTVTSGNHVAQHNCVELRDWMTSVSW